MSALAGHTMFFLFIFSFSIALQCVAQERLFQWSFVNNSTSLVECQSTDIVVQSLAGESGIGHPPYYMIAYEVNGLATVSPAGSDASRLSWTVDHRAGSDVILSLVDSAGNSGGVAPSTYSITDGSSSCLPSVPTAWPLINANTTKDLDTCQPLGLVMAGGVPPYTISIVQLGGSVRNVSLGSQDNAYTWINQAAPNSDLLVTVSDSNRHWAPRSVIINTTGSSNTTCPGLSSGSSSESLTVPRGGSANHTAIIIGVCLGVTVLVLVFCLVLFFVFLRMRSSKTIIDGQDVLPRSWMDDTLVSRSGTIFVSEGHKSLTVDLSHSRMSSRSHPVSPSSPRNSPLVQVPSIFMSHNYPPHEVLDISPANRPVLDVLDISPTSRPVLDVLDISPANRPVLDVLDISPTNRPVSPAASTHSNHDLRRSNPSPTPSASPGDDRASIASPIWPDPRIPRPPPVSPLSLSPIRSPTSPVRPLPRPPLERSPAPLSRKAREAASERHLRNVRSTGDVRCAVASPAPTPVSRPPRDASLARAQSLMNMRVADLSQGGFRESWTQDARGRDMVIIQHRDAIVQELPPPYDEILPGTSSLQSP